MDRSTGPWSRTKSRGQPQRKKKSSQTTFIMMAGGAALFFIILFAVVRTRPTKKEPPPPPPRTAQVNLSEQQKKEMYESLSALKSMLRNAGGNPRRSYTVLADRYSVSEEVVRQVEAEGVQKGWRASSP